EKWRDDEVIVVLRGSRVTGRYVLFRTGGADWMVRRMDPPPPRWTPMPDLVRPMHPVPAARLPADEDARAYEMRWDGVRAVGYASGGRLRLLSGDDAEITASYPRLRELAEALAPTEAVLDGELVAFDDSGRIRPAPAPTGGRPSRRTDVQYLLTDL